MSSFEAAETDFGALQIEQDADVDGELGGSGADSGDAGQVIVPGAVAGVEAEDVYSGVEHHS
jgi:hypothetical protein